MTEMHLRTFLAFFTTKWYTSSFRAGQTSELSEAKVTDGVNCSERRMAQKGFGCVDEVSGSDSPSGEHTTPSGLSDAHSNRRPTGSTRIIMFRRGSGGRRGECQELKSPSAISYCIWGNQSAPTPNQRVWHLLEVLIHRLPLNITVAESS